MRDFLSPPEKQHPLSSNLVKKLQYYGVKKKNAEKLGGYEVMSNYGWKLYSQGETKEGFKIEMFLNHLPNGNLKVKTAYPYSAKFSGIKL